MKAKVIYAIAGSTVASFLIGWLVFGILLASFYQSQTISYPGLMKDPPEMWAIVIMNLCFSTLLVYIFHTWAGIVTFMKGFMAGLVIFFLVMAGFDFSMYAFMNLMTLPALIVDILANTLMGGIVGGVAGMILGFGSEKTAG